MPKSTVTAFALTAALSFTAAASPAWADKVTDAIGKAAAAYKAGKMSTATTELQYALTKINERLAKAYTATFPAAPEGWRAQRVRTASGNVMVRVAGQILSRRYSQQGGRGSLNAQLIVDSPTMQAFTTLFANPNYARSAGYDPVKIEGVPETAMLKYDENRKQGDLILLMANRIVIKVTGRRIESGDVLSKLVKSWNIAQVRKTAGIK